MRTPATFSLPDFFNRQHWLATTVAVILIIGLAALFRLSDLGGRNLWTDEAWVALAALKPTPAAALAAGKSTPPLYLLAVWALTQLFGGSEMVLRSLSFLLGLGTVVLFWPLARSLTTTSPALLGLAALSVSPIMVYFSKELKQYSGDAFFAVLIFLLAERLRTRQGERGWLALALAGALGLGFSHTLIFVLPAAMVVLWFGLSSHLRPRLALVSAVWGLAFAAYYFLFFRHQVDPGLLAYWANDFPDFSGPVAFILWLGGAFNRYFLYFLGDWGIFWGAPLGAAGILHLAWQRRGSALGYFAGPLLLTFAAALLYRYPFMAHFGGNRLMLFSAPMLYLVVAVGFTASFAWLWHSRGWGLAPILVGLVLLSLKPVELVRENLHPSFNRNQIKPLVAHLERHLQPQDWVYVYYYAIYPFTYYFNGQKDLIYWGKSCVETKLDLSDKEVEKREDNDAARRLWLISAHYPSLEYMETFAASLLGPDWRQTACLQSQGALLYRFERRKTAPVKIQADRPGPSVSGSVTHPPEKAFE